MSDTLGSLHGYYIEDLEVGMSVSVAKAFSEADVALYAQISTDTNPLHLDDAFAARTRAGGRVIHGMITASLISAIVGTRLPGPGCLWMAQEMRFLAPVRIGETVQARAEVVEVDRSGQRAVLSVTCEVKGKKVLDGRSTVWVPSRDDDFGHD